MSPALPGTRGLFSALQHALSRGDSRRVRLNQQVYDTAADFQQLVLSLGSRPTRLHELVPTAPVIVGASDACRHGMGGVWLDGASAHPTPLLWRYPFPAFISQALVTSDNPRGSLSISDLELAAIVAHGNIIAQTRDVRERTLWVASDNRAAVSWSTKGSSTSLAARAYLLRLKASHQRHHRYLARHHYIPGPVNAMADDASRLWALSDSELISHFNSHYPQAHSWHVHPLTSAMSASVIGALCKQRLPIELPTSATPPLPPVGTSGLPSVAASNSIPSPWALATPSRSCSSSPSATAPEPLRPAATLSALAQWRTPYERWARRTPGWGPLTLA